MTMEVQARGDEPMIAPLSELWNDFSDSRWMEPEPIAMSKEHLNNILAVTDEMKLACAKVISDAPEELFVASPSAAGAFHAA
jgi:hypothetical protein